MKQPTNPYAKSKHTKHRRITHKQKIAILCGVIAIVLIAGISIITRFTGNSADLHAGHNHAPGEDCNTTPNGGHYEGDGHNHNTPASPTDSKLSFQLDHSGDTYTYSIYNDAKELLFKRVNLTDVPVKMAANGGLTLVYFKSDEVGYSAGDTAYCNEKTGQVSAAFHGAIDTDGVRVAYCNADDTAIIVQDLFNKSAYYREYPLEGVYAKGDFAILNAKLSQDKKSVSVTYYIDASKKTQQATIPLYE